MTQDTQRSANTFWWPSTTSRSRSPRAKSRRGRSTGNSTSPFDPPTSRRWHSRSLASRPHHPLLPPPLHLPYQRIISPWVTWVSMANQATSERDCSYRPRPKYLMVQKGERSISIDMWLVPLRICRFTCWGWDDAMSPPTNRCCVYPIATLYCVLRRCSRYPLRHYVWWVISGCLHSLTVTATYITVRMTYEGAFTVCTDYGVRIIPLIIGGILKTSPVSLYIHILFHSIDNTPSSH